MSEIKLTIDGQEVTANNGDTVLEAAQNAGIRIPTICAHPALEPYGACRLCVVQIKGIRGNPTSCTTPAQNGMIVDTKSEDIVELRREILKLMLSGHTSPCFACSDRTLCEKYRPSPTKSGTATRCTFCSFRGSCELRKLADEFEITEFDLPVIYQNIDIEHNDPFMDRDYNLCILCGRCSRICKKIHGRGAIDFINRGKNARIGTSFHKKHTETDCSFCGACIDICPTGSLSDRFAKWHGTPDKYDKSVCILCSLGCSIDLKIKNGRVIESGVVDFTPENRICAVGRFAIQQLLYNPLRLDFHQVRMEDGLIKDSYENAIDKAAEELMKYQGDQFALIAHTAATREEIYLLGKFSKKVMKSDNFAIAKPDKDKIIIEPSSVLEKIKNGTVKALFTTGNYPDSTLIEKLETLIIADMFPSENETSAKVVFASAALVEVDGTFLNAKGKIESLSAAATPPKDVYSDWKIVCDIAGKMGASEFKYSSIVDIGKEINQEGIQEETPTAPVPSPINDVNALPKFYRGHKLADVVSALSIFSPEAQTVKADTIPEELKSTVEEKPFKIVEKKEIVPNTYVISVYAPTIAEKCLPGQFVIAMVNEKSERIPYTISDFDRKKGTITMVTLEVGRSSREMANTRIGQHLAHFVGPLGKPVEIKKYGTVLCAGGCFGVGAILPIARAMKEAGNKVICIEEASSHYLLHWEKRLADNCDELVIVTKDGSAGLKGGAQDAIAMLAKKEEKIDQAYIIGCTFMMMLCCEVTKKLKIPTQTAMNPIMLDGTGMCGACRVSEGEKTKFACVDGPFLDGLQIDWIELMQRQAAFKIEEIVGLPQEPVEKGPEGHSCSCSNT